jgi:hypothetical protein
VERSQDDTVNMQQAEQQTAREMLERIAELQVRVIELESQLAAVSLSCYACIYAHLTAVDVA